MSHQTWLKPAGQNIVHEDFGDEMVIVNLDTGKYYSFNPVGAAIWASLVSGNMIKNIVEATHKLYAGDQELIAQEVIQFLHQLQKEGLIVPTIEGQTGEANTTISGEMGTYVSPGYEVFTDMEDLLLLDPIHDVDETGWPHQPGTQE